MRITLCGSSRFVSDFDTWNRRLTLAGHVVYALSMHGRHGEQGAAEGKAELPLVTDEQKVVLDLAHLLKIKNSDAVGVLNVGAYVGDSTRREVLFARMTGKRVYWLEGADYVRRDDLEIRRIWDNVLGRPVGDAP